MQRVRDLLARLDLPAVGATSAPEYRLPAAHVLGAELPQGHLHVWSGPAGAGKTAFLLGLLREAARHGRPTTLATYDLSASTLALRLLAMEAGVSVDALERGTLERSAAEAAAHARARFATAHLYVLEARGLSTASLEDRLVRSPVRFDVLGIDYVEAIVRPGGAGGDAVPATLHDLSELAKRRWLAVVATSRPAGDAVAATRPASDADRVGWLAPADERGATQASLLMNRHGGLASCRIRLDGASARWVDDAPPPAPV